VEDRSECTIVEIQVDVSAAPEQYSVFHIVDTIENLADERIVGRRAILPNNIFIYRRIPPCLGARGLTRLLPSGGRPGDCGFCVCAEQACED